LSIASAGVPPLPPAITRSVFRPTIFSTSIVAKSPTSGTLSAAGGNPAGSWTLPTTRSPAPMANRTSVSAGVSETILSGSAASLTIVPSSSVRLTGKAGPGEMAASDGGTVAVAAGTRAPVASGGIVGRGDPLLEQAARARTVAAVATARAARTPKRGGRSGRGRIVPVPFSRR
jgi:hypothetical protein